MEGQLKITFGMSEIFIIGSIAIHQVAFWYSIALLVLGIFGKFTAYAIELQKQKESAENASELTKSFVDTISNAIALGGIVGNREKNGNGFH